MFVLCALWWMRLRDLCRHPDGRDWWWVELDLVPLVGRAMLNKTLVCLSSDEWSCDSSKLLAWSEAFQHWRVQVVEWCQALVTKCGPPGENMLISITWDFCYQCPIPHSDL